VDIKLEEIEFLVVFSREISRLSCSKDPETKKEAESVKNQMIDMLMSPEFLENPALSPKLCEIGAFYCLHPVVKARVDKLKYCIRNKSVFMNDLKYCILHWNKMSEQTMIEIIMKLLIEKYTLSILYEEQVQKNITKIFLVRIYTGAELLSRISIRMWNKKHDKDLLNAIEQHIKEPF